MNMEMKVSEIQVMPVTPKDGLVGFASVIINDSLYLGSIGIYTRPQGGYRLTYPTRNGPKGGFHVFRPINKDFGELIERLVITKFEELVRPYFLSEEVKDL